MNSNRSYFAMTFDSDGCLPIDDTVWFSDRNLRIEVHNLHPLPRKYQLSDFDIFLFGNPIADEHREDSDVVNVFKSTTDIVKSAGLLNGSFLVLVYSRKVPELTIINDRFASIALYEVVEKNVWHASSTLKKLWGSRISNNRIDATAVAEFLFLRRLFGEKTLAQSAKYLESASILSLKSKGQFTKTKYWVPDYDFGRPSNRELPELIAEGLSGSMAMHQSDDGKFGLLLSGGLDSRALLAAANRPLQCYTTCLKENNESAVARELANMADVQFCFLPRPPDLYDKMLDDAVFLTGGHQIYTENQFLGFGELLKDVNTLFIGLGLDIFFGGLYLPKEPQRILGRQALHYRLVELSSNLSAMFLDSVGYRLKQSDPNLVVKCNAQSSLRRMLLDSIGDILERGRRLGATGYDLWEFMHIHNLSRHYSFPMMHSVRTFADCRAPALENNILNLSLQMSADQKVNGTAYQKAIELLAPRLMEIRNANTNLPARLSLPRQTYLKMLCYGLYKLFGTSYPVSPGVAERSWPSPHQSLVSCPSIMKRVRELKKSDYLSSISFIDMNGVGTVVDDATNGVRDHSILLNLLLTLESSIRQDN